MTVEELFPDSDASGDESTCTASSVPQHGQHLTRPTHTARSLASVPRLKGVAKKASTVRRFLTAARLDRFVLVVGEALVTDRRITLIDVQILLMCSKQLRNKVARSKHCGQLFGTMLGMQPRVCKRLGWLTVLRARQSYLIGSDCYPFRALKTEEQLALASACIGCGAHAYRNCRAHPSGIPLFVGASPDTNCRFVEANIEEVFVHVGPTQRMLSLLCKACRDEGTSVACADCGRSPSPTVPCDQRCCCVSFPFFKRRPFRLHVAVHPTSVVRTSVVHGVSRFAHWVRGD